MSTKTLNRSARICMCGTAFPMASGICDNCGLLWEVVKASPGTIAWEKVVPTSAGAKVRAALRLLHQAYATVDGSEALVLAHAITTLEHGVRR